MGLISYINNAKISKKLSILSLIAVFALVIVLSASMMVVVRIALGNYMQNEVEAKAQVISNDIVAMEKKSAALVDWFVNSPRTIGALKTNNRKAFFDTAQLAIKAMDFDTIVITNHEGNVFFRLNAPDQFGDSITDRPNIVKALRGIRSTQLAENAITKISIVGTAPLKEGDNIVGAIAVGYTLSSNEFADKYKRLIGCEFTVFHFDERISTSLEVDGKRLIGTKLDNPFIVETVLKNGENYYDKNIIAGKDYYTAYIPLKDSNNSIIGMLFVGQETTVVDNLIKQLLASQTLSLLVIGVIFVFTCLFFLKKLFITKLNAVTDRLKDISEGEGDLTVSLEVASNDELGELSESFNKFVSKIRDIIRDIKHISNELTDMSKQLSISTGVFSDNAQGQAASIEEVNATTEELSAGMEFIANNTSIQQENLTQMVDKMVDVSTLINNMNTMITESHGLISSVSENARKGKTSISTMISSMNKINDSSSKVSNIIEIINEISDKINLLALNAAIESARAGVAGRGFAVVADEISKLAEETAGSIKQIDELVQINKSEIVKGLETNNDTTQILTGIIKGVESVTTMVNSLHGYMQKQIEARDEMNEVSNVVIDKTNDVKNSTSEHLISTEEIAKATSNINIITQSIATGAEEMATMSIDISKLATNLNNKVNSFKVDKD